MQTLLIVSVFIQMFALFASAIFIPANPQEMREWVKRVGN